MWTCIRRHLKETVPKSNITWSETGKQNVQAKEVYFNTNKLMKSTFFCRLIAMMKIKKKLFFCSFRCEEDTAECFSMQTEKLTRSLRVKILWSTGVFFCLFI